MNNQSAAFLANYLGPTATTPPSKAVADALRHWLLTDPLPNPLSVDDPRSIPGTWPDAYAVYHKLVTREEMRPRWDDWIAFERTQRGLPDGPLATPLIGHVYKASHFTTTQHWLIGAMHPVESQRKLSRAQALKLGELARADGVVTKPDWMSGSRGIGWTLLEEIKEYVIMGAATPTLPAITVLIERLQQAHGGADGHVWEWQNTNALKDDRHLYTICPWMDALALKGKALLHQLLPTPLLRDLILHHLRVFAEAQTADGRFVDDLGYDINGIWGSKDDGKEVMDPWIWVALLEARRVLDDDWPSWAENMVNKCESRFLVMNRMKPSDSGFRDLLTQGIAIAVAPDWGWRQP